MKLLYIIGEPATGKTTLCRAVVHGCKVEKIEHPIKHEKYGEDVIQIGWDRETFGGTDSLGMAIQPQAMEWLKTMPYKYVLAEGDRLANEKFFTWCKEQGIELTVMALTLNERLLEKRRAKRNRRLGKSQNERWLKTRKTKTENLINNWVDGAWLLDAKRNPSELKYEVYRHPVGKAIRKAKKLAKQGVK